MKRTEHANANATPINPIPDDRPVSVEERLRGCTFQRDAARDDAARQAAEVERLRAENERLRAALSTPAGPGTGDNAARERDVAILERDEMRRANVTPEDADRPLGQSVEYWQDRCLDHATALDNARVENAQLRAALSAARPSSSTPEGARHHAWFRCIDGGWGGYQAMCTCGWEGEERPPGAEGKRAARTDVAAHESAAATTKEGR